jgi:hypothetical protein
LCKHIKNKKTKLNNPYSSIYGQLTENTHDVLKMVLVWQIIHVRIEVNFAAHCLVKVAIKQVMDQVWMEDVSTSISILFC